MESPDTPATESRHSLAAIAERQRRARMAMEQSSPISPVRTSADHIQSPTSPITSASASPSPTVAATNHPLISPSLTTHLEATPSSFSTSTIISPNSLTSLPDGPDSSALIDSDVVFPSSSNLTDSYLSLQDPSVLVSTLPNSTSFDASLDQSAASKTEVERPNYVPVDSLDTEFSSTPPSTSHSPHITADPPPAKKDSRAQRFANFFKRDKKKSSKEDESPKQDKAESAPTSSGNSLLALLRSTSSGSSSEKKRKKALKKEQEKRAKEKKSASASPVADHDEDYEGSESNGQKRSIYAQKLIHLSNSIMNIFTSGASSSQPASLMAFSQQQHTFTNSPAWILGKVYKLLGPPPTLHHADVASSVSVSTAQLNSLALRRARFLSDFTSQIWCTYRRNFPTIATSVYTSDAGWGCMIRSAQMMLAQVFVRHYLGREWRLPERIKQSNLSADFDEEDTNTSVSDSSLPPLPAAYIRILSLFLDSPSSSAPYSIHNLLHNGQSSKDKKVGEWFGPHNACWMLKKCMEGELAKLESKLASGQSITTFEEGGLTSIPDGFGNEEVERQHGTNSSHTPATASPSSPTASAVPSAYAVPKIYVSDDGTLYLDKIMQLVRVNPVESTTISSESHLGDEVKSDMESPSSKPRSYSGSSPSFNPAAASIPHPPHFSSNFHPLMILIPLRLGMDKLNPNYIPSLLSLFQFPQCIGIIGGKPRTSLYFIGVQDEHLFYLDPHTVQKSWDLTGTHSLRGSLGMKYEISDSYHCSNVLSISVSQIDPSLAIGFYIENQEAMDAFWDQAKHLTDVTQLQAHTASHSSSSSSSSSAGTLLPVFHVADVSPNYEGFGDSDGSTYESGDDDDEAGRSEEEEGLDPSEADFESARAAEAAAAETEESPEPIHTSSLPTDALGRPLNMDSLTTSPVLCPQSNGPLEPANAPDSLSLNDSAILSDSLIAVDGQLIPPPSEPNSTPSSSIAAHPLATSAAASVSALTDLTYAFSAAAATRLHSSARTLSEYAVSAASQAQGSLANLSSNIAAQAAQLQQASLAAAQRKLSREPPEPQTTATATNLAPAESTMTSPVMASPPPPSSSSTSSPMPPPHLVTPTPNRLPAPLARPIGASSSTASTSVCSTSERTKPFVQRKSSSKSSAQRANRRKGSKAMKEGEEDEFVFL